jgi:uncharacterized protein (DUF608 family)
MALIRSTIEHVSGIPLGGLGTGTIEIRPDGYFHEWQIFNTGKWAPGQPVGAVVPTPPTDPRALSFFLRTRQGSYPPRVRRLGMRSDQHDMLSFPWMGNVSAIEFDGRYPTAELHYIDDGLPVGITATMYSPIIPHQARVSGTPGFNVVFTVENLDGEPVEVSLMGLMKNPLAWGEKQRQLVNTITRAGEATFLTMRSNAQVAYNPTLGSLGMSVSGGEASWVTGEFPRYFFLDSQWYYATSFGMALETFHSVLRDRGRLSSLAGDRQPTDLLRLTDEELAVLTPAAQDELIKQALRFPSLAEGLRDRVLAVDPHLLETPAGRVSFLKDVRIRLDVLMGKDRARQVWGDGALCSTLTLAPGETREIRFTVGWHFPNHFSARGPVIGHMYEHWFADAEAVNRFLVERHDDHRKAVVEFTALLGDTSLNPRLAEAWTAQLSTLAKSTWWTKADEFGVWEGLGCCGFHTTDVGYSGSFSLLALYPELELKQMRLGARFQRQDGRVHHMFTPDLAAVDDGFDRVDMNQQFVLMACRDWLWTGDRDHLQRLWPHLLSAMANTAKLDTDGDGLPDRDTGRNTYDAWNFFGTPAYISSLWMSALVAAARIADDLGHAEQAAAWRKTLALALASFERRLWNGEYYSLWVDGEKRDEGCMSDQLNGEWFTRLIGLGNLLPEERVRAVLKAVVKYNFSFEGGLINASYPPGAQLRMFTHQNMQAVVAWTGIEYLMASMLFDYGLPLEAHRVVFSVHERYLRAGLVWNHQECGEHYYRAMSSWAVLLAATGFKIDVPRRTLSIVPAVTPALAGFEVRAPWFSATAYGRFRQAGGRFELKCVAGSLVFKTLRLGLGQAARPTLNGAPLAATSAAEEKLTAWTFAEPVTMKAGDVLVVGG